MATEILAVGTTAASSSDVTVTADGLTVCLKDAAGTTIPDGAYVYIELKDDAGAYFRVDGLEARRPARFLAAPGTYRFTRPKTSVACGVFSA